MKPEKLNSWLTLGANAGVLIGLILLVYEIRQNSDLMRAQMRQSRSETARDGYQVYMESDHIPEITLKLKKNEVLTEEESLRYSYYFRGIMRNLENLYWQNSEGFLDDTALRSITFYSREIIGTRSGGFEIWDHYKTNYADDYVAFVEEAIADLQ